MRVIFHEEEMSFRLYVYLQFAIMNMFLNMKSNDQK